VIFYCVHRGDFKVTNPSTLTPNPYARLHDVTMETFPVREKRRVDEKIRRGWRVAAGTVSDVATESRGHCHAGCVALSAVYARSFLLLAFTFWFFFPSQFLAVLSAPMTV
jgi:hypothetical protein